MINEKFSILRAIIITSFLDHDRRGEMLEFVDELEALQERPKGRWVKYNSCTLFANTLACSKCGYNFVTPESNPNYCPCCGADMRGEEE